MTGLGTRVLVAALVLGGTAACGDGDTPAGSTAATSGTTTTAAPAGSGADIDACALVTQADAERILGEPFELMETSEPEVVLASCVWSNLADDHGALLQFRIFDGAQFFSEDAYSTIDGYSPADGIGDDAYWVVDDNTVTLTVLAGDLVFVLDASKGGGGFDPPSVQAELLVLAQGILAAI